MQISNNQPCFGDIVVVFVGKISSSNLKVVSGVNLSLKNS